MKYPKFSITAVLIALVAMVAVPAQAQDAPAQAQEHQETHYHELIGALETMDEQLLALEQTSADQVETVNVGEIKTNLDDEQLGALEDAHRNADADALHAALSEHTAIVTALGEEDVTVAEVVAVDVTEDNVVVYYDSVD